MKQLWQNVSLGYGVSEAYYSILSTSTNESFHHVRTRIFTQSLTVPPRKCYQLPKQTLSFTDRKPGGRHREQVIEVHITRKDRLTSAASYEAPRRTSIASTRNTESQSNHETPN